MNIVAARRMVVSTPKALEFEEDQMSTSTRAPGWQLDTTGAANYERNLVPVMEPWAADLLGATGVERGHRVLDVACGTGIVSRHAVRRVGPDGAVTGVDINPAMLDLARGIATETGAEIRYVEAPADGLPVGDATFDVVLCQQGLQFFPDPARALDEMHRVLVDGGRLGVSTCRSLAEQPGYRALVAALARHVDDRVADVIASPYALGEPDELRRLVSAAGFTDVVVRMTFTTFRLPSAEALVRAETASSPLGDIVEALPTDVRRSLLEDLGTALAPFTDDEGVVFPFGTVTATATR